MHAPGGTGQGGEGQGGEGAGDGPAVAGATSSPVSLASQAPMHASFRTSTPDAYPALYGE